MSLLAYVLLFSFLGGVVSLAGGVALLIWRNKLHNISDDLTSFAAGVMIAISVLDLLPEAFAEGNKNVPILLLIGVVFLFVLERTSLWFHHHHEPHGHAPEITGLFLGDTLHNFIDGIAIGAAFLIGIPVGIATALGVGMHELPQEIADFSLYLKSGMSRKKTLTLNLLSSLVTIVGAVGVYFLGNVVHGLEMPILALTAGMFLYIALADLVPELHEEKSRGKGIRQLAVFFLGILIAYWSIVTLKSK
jgi:zinc and cadmium transporter